MNPVEETTLQSAPTLVFRHPAAPAAPEETTPQRHERELFAALDKELRPMFMAGGRSSDLAKTAGRYRDYARNRIRQLERVLQALVTAVEPEQRGGLLQALYGVSAEFRDQGLLSETEADTLARYRRLDTATRTAFRRLIVQLTDGRAESEDSFSSSPAGDKPEGGVPA